MKRVATILITFLNLSLLSCDGDEISSKDLLKFDNVETLCDVLPPGDYSAVRFTSQNTAYTITNNGKIFKTVDGGNTWSQQNSGTEMHLYGMSFIDNLHGYIVGGDGDGVFLKTSDGGNTWLSTNFQAGLSSVYFINENIGFVAAGKKFLKTQDGGITWNEIDLGFFSYGGINFFDKKNGFLTAGNVILKTTDVGNNWEAIKDVLGNSSIKKIQIFNDIACLLSTGSKIFITFDRGVSWSSIEPPNMNSVYFINEHQAIGVAQRWPELGYFPNGILYLTNDGGRHWEEKYTIGVEEFYNIKDIDFSNDSTALAVGQTNRGCIIKLRF